MTHIPPSYFIRGIFHHLMSYFQVENDARALLVTAFGDRIREQAGNPAWQELVVHFGQIIKELGCVHLVELDSMIRDSNSGLQQMNLAEISPSTLDATMLENSGIP